MKSDGRASLDKIAFRHEPNDARAAELGDRLIEFNRTRSLLWEQNHDARFTAQPLQIFALHDDGRLVAGLTGRTHALREWFELAVLWVDEPFSGLGLGRGLMEAAEAEAVRRGCRHARLSTSGHQAPEFYVRLGYALYGTLQDCPPGETAYYLHKTLT